ncbi:hypothetical protein [uncultured Methanobrevibacter sp.]|uniref:hypothetical protein n=1 Tax=uncultured Methanobrevibacter sp. TaxID=253161 RepID=UPI0025D2F47C|nr:hypothetical protein [uncultured Methanobrevibacter sp.]
MTNQIRGAIAVTYGYIFKHYHVRIFLHSNNGIPQTLTIECKNKESQNKLVNYINELNGVYDENEDLKQENKRLVQSLFFANNQEKWEQKINDTK